MKNLAAKFINVFLTVCILSFLAALSTVPVALAIKFIMWLF